MELNIESFKAFREQKTEAIETISSCAMELGFSAAAIASALCFMYAGICRSGGMSFDEYCEGLDLCKESYKVFWKKEENEDELFRGNQGVE